MLVLGIETATKVVSAAITKDGVLQSQEAVNRSKPHSGSLVHSIDVLLKSLHLSGQSLDGIAVSIGPGSYTGLRIGLSVAKSLAYCWDKPLAGVNSLDTLAQRGRNQEALICPIIRFRRDEYYHALYDRSGSSLKRKSEYLVGSLRDILESLHQPSLFLGELIPGDKELLETLYGDHAHSEEFPEAFSVAALGEVLLSNGSVEDASKLTPFYMHEFPVVK